MQISTRQIELCMIFSLMVSIVYAETQYPTDQTVKTQTKSQTPKTQATQRPQVSDSVLDDALNDKRFIQRQIKCALGQAPCDPIGRRLKTLAPLVLRGACPQCTPQETKQIQRTLSYVQRNFPQDWAKIVKQYAG